MRTVEVDAIYKHHRNKKHYRVVGVGKHRKTLEDMVFYESLYDNPVGKFWIRELDNFLEEVEVDGKKVQRFTKIDEERPA